MWGRKEVAIPIGAVTKIGTLLIHLSLTKHQVKDLPPVTSITQRGRPPRDTPYPGPTVTTWSATTPRQVQGDSPFPALTRKRSDPGTAPQCPGVPLSVGASAPPPARDQGPDRSLPGPDAGHPLQGARVSQEGEVAVPVACPIRQPTVGTGSHSRIPPYAR